MKYPVPSAPELAVIAADILAQAPDPVCLFDREFRHVYANAAYEIWAGAPSERLLGRTPHQCGFAPEMAAKCVENLRRVFSSGELSVYTEELSRDAIPRSFELRLSPQRSDSGAIDAVALTAREITAQKQTERELEKARRQLFSILDSINESFLALDREWRFTFVNSHVLQQTGKSREEIIGRNIWDLCPPLNDTIVRPEFERVARTRDRSHFEASLQNGRIFEVHAYPSDEGVSAVVIDITDRKMAERELREAHDTFSALVHASPLPIVYLTSDGNITVWNEAAERVFGWTKTEVLGKPLPFIPEDKLEEHREMRARDLDGVGFSEHEITRRRKDGSVVEISVSTAPIRGADGEIRGIVCVYQDITERKTIERGLRQNEQLLREREEAFRIATDAASIGVWMYDVAQDRLKLSPLAARLAGFSEQELDVGVRQLLQRVHEDDRQRVKQEINEALEQGNEYASEYRVVLAGGEVRWIAARGLADSAAGGDTVRFSGVVSDITERKKVEEELARHSQELARSNADLQQFAFVTSHDLQEPLRSIASYAQLLARRFGDTLDSDAREYVGFMVEGAARMQQLINDLLAFSRVLHGHERELAEVDMELVFAWAIMNLNKAIQESGAVITHDPLPVVLGNQQEIIQLAQNLLGNAIKYHGSDPPAIHVSSEEFDQEVLFSVRDNGIGIDAAYHDLIFGVFKRLHGKNVPGTGIGLALAKRIVEKHGGRIWVESEEGKGATFRFTLRKP